MGADHRRQLLVHLPSELIKVVKKLAVDDDTTASAIVKEALLIVRLRLFRRFDVGAFVFADGGMQLATIVRER